MIKHIAKALTKAVMGFALGVTIYFGVSLIWWEFGSYESILPKVVEPIVVHNKDKQVASDEPVQLKVIIDKPRDISPKNVSVKFFCDNDRFYDATGLNSGIRLPVGLYQRDVQFFAPAGLPVGATCTFTFTQDYEVNPIKTITKVWTSERFKVVE